MGSSGGSGGGGTNNKTDKSNTKKNSKFKEPSNQEEQENSALFNKNLKQLGKQVNSMEIGSNPNSPTNNNNQKSNVLMSDDDLSNTNRLDTLDHPPSKKLLTSNNSRHLITQIEQPLVASLNTNRLVTEEDIEDDDKMDSSLSKQETTQNTQPQLVQSSQLVNESTAANNSIDLVDNENIDDESRAEATFQLVVDEFTKFKDNRESRLSAQPCIVRNLPWKILAMSKPANNRDYTLGFFLQCNAESEST